MTYENQNSQAALAKSIEQRVINVVKGIATAKIDEISLDSHFVNDLKTDSLDMVEIVMAMETEFNIEISDDDAKEIQTVGDAVQYVLRNMKVED